MECNSPAVNGKARSQSLPALPRTQEISTLPLRRLSLNLDRTHAPIARGGFSDVYRTDCPGYGLVAVKRLRFNETERDELEAMVAKETQVLSKICHTHILPFLGISYLDGGICIVSPWAEYGPLSEYLTKNPEADRLGLLTQVASALSYLHTNVGDIIIHGDLHLVCLKYWMVELRDVEVVMKENVLISATKQALLSDFGLSRIVPEGNSSSLYRGDTNECPVGKALYEAPELHDGEPRSWATDVFAFGMLVFHAFSGTRPLTKATNYISAVLSLYQGDRPARSEVTRHDFTDSLWDLVCTCWNHSPRQRWRMPHVVQYMQKMLLDRMYASCCSQPSP